MKIHLFVLVHGIFGTPADMAWIGKVLSQQRADVHVLLVSSLKGRTTESLETSAQSVVADILTLEKFHPADLAEDFAISFISHSLGGLVARATIGKLEELRFFDRHRPMNFVTFATPHLGIRQDAMIMLASAHMFGGKAGVQLTLTDVPGVPFLVQMTQGVYFEGLKKFQQRLAYANVRNDIQVNYQTAGITNVYPYPRGIRKPVAIDPRYPHIVHVDVGYSPNYGHPFPLPAPPPLLRPISLTTADASASSTTTGTTTPKPAFSFNSLLSFASFGISATSTASASASATQSTPTTPSPAPSLSASPDPAITPLRPLSAPPQPAPVGLAILAGPDPAPSPIPPLSPPFPPTLPPIPAGTRSPIPPVAVALDEAEQRRQQHLLLDLADLHSATFPAYTPHVTRILKNLWQLLWIRVDCLIPWRAMPPSNAHLAMIVRREWNQKDGADVVQHCLDSLLWTEPAAASTPQVLPTPSPSPSALGAPSDPVSPPVTVAAPMPVLVDSTAAIPPSGLAEAATTPSTATVSSPQPPSALSSSSDEDVIPPP
ncbi:putative lipase serine esterase [Paratrimastix pyriformis]|uniref:Lipase serine esterase n=1 Tax=Paratrimastix pyriformis TaxID=342808 RepID=A0ABQ8ULS3_9EUKA|nr:putative lipase serine esterase [Paratrimastix pyriformis]